MAENSDKADDLNVEEVVNDEVQVELDKQSGVEGELVPNPVLEEESEEVDASKRPAVDDTQTTEGNDDSGDDAGGEGDSSDEAETVGDDNKTDTTQELTPEKDEEGVYAPKTAVDPGAFVPTGDYGFEVTTIDGKKVVINSPEEAEAFANRLDSEDGVLSASQFMEFNRKVAKMDRGIEGEQAKFETDKVEFDRQQNVEKVKNEQITQWSNELRYLETKGNLPPIPKAIDVPGGWEANPDDPGVKARMEIFKWMETENTTRRDAGLTEVTSALDAQRMMQSEAAQTQEDTQDKADRSTRQAKGRMVSGSSSGTTPNEQPGRIIGEGGSLRDLVTEASNNL